MSVRTAKNVVLNVLLSTPDNLDGSFHLLADEDRLLDEVGLLSTPESAAEQEAVHDHFVGAQAQERCDCVARLCWRLGPDPDFHAIALDAHGAIHRLHGGVCQNLIRLYGFDPSGVGRDHHQRVAIVSRHDARALQRLDHQVVEVFGLQLGIGALVPFDVESCDSLPRIPVVVGDDGDRVAQRDDISDAGQGTRGVSMGQLHAILPNTLRSTGVRRTSYVL